MPRGGSKKGEHRGNAKKRLETPNDVMREAVTTPQRGPKARLYERRIEVARVIHGPSGRVEDMTPKEVLLSNMHFFMQTAFDWQDSLMKVAAEKPADENAERERAVRIAECEGAIERYRALASEDAYKVAPFIHPRLAAVAVGGNAGENSDDVIAALLDDVDKRSREPKTIEHQAQEKAEA